MLFILLLPKLSAAGDTPILRPVPSRARQPPLDPRPAPR